MLLTRTQIRRLVYAHGREILEHDHMAIERVCYQHGVVTTFAHSIRVACLSVWLADRLHLWNRVDLRSLIRAALLHDYFLYDWHDWDNGTHRLHGSDKENRKREKLWNEKQHGMSTRKKI